MKNPLIPMGAIAGNLTREQIQEILNIYHAHGIEQFMIYPRDGCEVEYMSERWFEICSDFIEIANFLNMDIWIYDEFNWPSGTCLGKVTENPELRAECIVMDNGEPMIKPCAWEDHIGAYYSDLLNPKAAYCFIENTHQKYYEHFSKYFGNTIKGFFTDEPGFCYNTYHKKFEIYKYS